MFHAPGAAGSQTTEQAPLVTLHTWLGNVAPVGPVPVNVTVPVLIFCPSVAVSVVERPTPGLLGDAVTVTPVLELPTLICWVVEAEVKFESPLQEAVIAQLPFCVGVHDTEHTPFLGAHVVAASVTLFGPVPLKVMVPSLTGTESVAVSVVG
jgi:hypothetical protein